MVDNTRDQQVDDRYLLSTSPPSPRQNRLAASIVVVLLVALAATIPFARVPLSGTQPFLPAYAAAVLVNELITSALLLSLFSARRSVAVLVLASGYLFSGLLVVPWALTFPGVFATSGLLEASVQTTAAIAALRRVGFPLFVLGYAVLSSTNLEPTAPRRQTTTFTVTTVSAIVTVAYGVVWLILTGDASLPKLMADHQRSAAAWEFIPPIAAAVSVSAMVVLWRRRRSLVDLWLLVVLFTFLVEILLLSYLSSGRFSVGWWAGRLYGLASASFVLLVLLSETTTLQGRLVRSISAERRAREARLSAMEALSASIAHEINQPLASMVTNADAGLRWLDKESPDVDETRSALRRIADSGQRAGEIIRSVRAMFRKDALQRGPINLNELIQDVLRHGQREGRFDTMSIHAALDATLPLVTGDAVQLRQVVSNLLANAIDAMQPVTDRPRMLHVRTTCRDPDGIEVSVEDTGIGLPSGHGDRVFEPFFTTKSEGMGMGLIFSRSVVESHGGRLWISENALHGVTAHFTLPRDDAAVRPAAG
ncbi:sensor histidine kinase [Desertibaculum subflavum]|uniref:sensor histidine kinase n=1 Tax=Desertibaculum subflavum TaxID=2268458 RepID=UPI000E664406